MGSKKEKKKMSVFVAILVIPLAVFTVFFVLSSLYILWQHWFGF